MKKLTMAICLALCVPVCSKSQMQSIFSHEIFSPATSGLQLTNWAVRDKWRQSNAPVGLALTENDYSDERHKPNVLTVPSQIAGGYLVGGLTGIGFGLVAMGLLSEFGGEQQDSDTFEGFFIGAYLGYMIGSGVGSHAVGEHAGMRSPLIASIAGSTAGSLIGYSVLTTTKHGWGMLINPPVFATISFHFTRSK